MFLCSLAHQFLPPHGRKFQPHPHTSKNFTKKRTTHQVEIPDMHYTMLDFKNETWNGTTVFGVLFRRSTELAVIMMEDIFLFLCDSRITIGELTMKTQHQKLWNTWISMQRLLHVHIQQRILSTPPTSYAYVNKVKPDILLEEDI